MTSLSFALLGTVKVSAKCSTQEMEYLAECSYKSIIPFPLFFLQLLCTDLPSKRSTFYPLGTQPAKLSQVMWGERKRELWCQEVEREDDVAPLPS